MATTAKDTSQGKQKTKAPSSSTQHNDTTHGRKTSKPLVAGSTTSKGLAIVTDKPSPHYLKPTVCSAKDIGGYPKKPTSDDTSLKNSHSRRKSIEKPPSPSQLKRTLSSTSPKGRRLTASSPPPKKGSPPKSSERTSRTPTTSRTLTPKNGKAQPLSKPATVKKSTSTTTRPKKETKPITSGTTTPTTPTTPPTPDTSETPLVNLEEEDKGTPVQDVQEQPTAVVEEEQVQVENSPTNDQLSIDPKDSEMKNSDSCDSSILSEEHELIAETPTEDIEERRVEVADDENKPKEEEQSKNNEDDSEHPEESKPQVEANKVEEKEGETGEDDTSEKKEISNDNAASWEASGEVDKSQKFKFQQGKRLDEKEVEDEGNQRLKFKERKEDGEIIEGKAESENVVLKHQDVQGKKESLAYNDVIEETASKLVGKRNSKVKALVGAFETVINLENDTQQTEGE